MDNINNTKPNYGAAIGCVVVLTIIVIGGIFLSYKNIKSSFNSVELGNTNIDGEYNVIREIADTDFTDDEINNIIERLKRQENTLTESLKVN